MWRNLSRQAAFKKFKFSSEPHFSVPSCASTNFIRDSYFIEEARFFGTLSCFNSHRPQLGFHPNSNYRHKDEKGSQAFYSLSSPFGFSGGFRSYGSVAQAIVSTSEEDVDEFQEEIEEIKSKSKILQSNFQPPKQPKMVGGMGSGKYHILRRRQMKMETEAWEEAAKEYQELLADMCEQKLAPNLPYMKSLFLGWFEPLRDAIAAEQELCDQGKNRTAYAPYFNHLPAEMMAVISMHKLMGLLMTGEGHGSAKVVQAACHIGEAIEHEVRIHKFLERTKRKNSMNRRSEEEIQPVVQDQDKLRKKVNVLMKKQKLQQVRKIVKQYDDAKPWGQDNQVKVGCRLIQILMETAYIQPPNDQVEDGIPDIRPAFVHTLRSVETPQGTRRYGVIECDPLVRKGLERTARHMVIPYMPMLIPPLNWSGYDKGAHLFLPSYIMRTHGAKQQKDAVKRCQKAQLEPVFQALNTLGNTKWRVNKRILAVVDRIWSSGGQLADLVDREDVPLPEKPDTEDEQEIKTSLQVLTLQRETDKVMVKRQKSAFPPNFVHSLDGSHMMMTAVACREAGLNFAGVHDSYWTHACDVDQMNRILREKFVELYEAPILENLLESFETSFPKLKFPPLPERGDFDLREVLDSPYFFN